jgi:hypothetical protein
MPLIERSGTNPSGFTSDDFSFPKEKGGLGVPNLAKKNVSLLKKFLFKFHRDVVFSYNTTFDTFVNEKKHAKILRYYKEDRKQDQMLRHPADGSSGEK